jgi:hypothetical protein
MKLSLNLVEEIIIKALLFVFEESYGETAF